MKKTVNWGVLGAAAIATGKVIPAFKEAPSALLLAFASRDPEKGRATGQQFSIPRIYSSYDELLADPDIDVVYVVTPNALHAEHTIKAAKAGKHVLSEKPMEVSVKKCEEMIAACRDAGRKLAVGYRCQFEPHHLECMRLAREKVFGDIKIVEAGFGFRLGDPPQRRLRRALAGGGPLPDVGVYCINATRYLSGEEPVQVSATLYQPKDDPRFKDVEESAAWWMRFPSGALAHCATSYGVSLGGRYRFSTRDAQVLVDPSFNYGGLHMTIVNRGKPEPVDLPNIDQFAAEMDDFADCVLNDKPTRTPGEEGLADVKILRKLYESAEAGKTLEM